MTQNQSRNESRTDEKMKEKDGCSVGCFPGRANSVNSNSHISQNCAKSRHCETSSEATNNWKCPDPGCKTINSNGKDCCAICHLPRHSSHQFKRGESKILKQL